MIGEVDGLGQVYGMGGEEEEEDDAINEDMARLGMSSTGEAGRKGRETTTRRKARKKGAGTVGVGGKGRKGKQDTTESTLRLRVDGQRHAIRALEKVIADLKKQLSRKKGGKGGSGSGGANVVSPERRKGEERSDELEHSSDDNGVTEKLPNNYTSGIAVLASSSPRSSPSQPFASDS